MALHARLKSAIVTISLRPRQLRKDVVADDPHSSQCEFRRSEAQRSRGSVSVDTSGELDLQTIPIEQIDALLGQSLAAVVNCVSDEAGFASFTTGVHFATGVHGPVVKLPLMSTSLPLVSTKITALRLTP